jgi:hypothetical protein
MKFKLVMHSAIAAGLALSAAACRSGPPEYTGPGCLIYVYSLPDLQGYALPVRESTSELSEAWSKSAASARVVYGTWRLYSQPTYEGFMGDFKAPTNIMRLEPPHRLGSLACLTPEPPPPPPPRRY